MKETFSVRLVRAAFRLWPFMHGRGWILRIARLFLHDRVVFDLGDQTFIEGSLDDWIILWAFMCRHEKDMGFMRSLRMVEPGSVVLDVGAHVGIWSLLAARREPSARIHAFEPVPAQLDRLRKHVSWNHLTNIEINGCAVGAENGRTSFYAVYDGNSGASSLVARGGNQVEIQADVVSLDSYIDRADVMKVDVEGAELLVFQGAKALLASDHAPAIFFESDEGLSASFGGSREVKNLLRSHGYALYRWKSSRFVPVTLHETHHDENLFALKERP